MKDILKSKRVVVFGLPGAFTPVCSNSHVPSFIQYYDELKKKNIDSIICVSVNDPFVMSAWAVNLNTENKIKMLADVDADLAKALQLEVNVPVLGKIPRIKRFSMFVDDGVVKSLNVDEAGASTTLADHILKQIQ